MARPPKKGSQKSFWTKVFEMLPSLKLTYPLKIVVFNRSLLLQRSIFGGYVSFREGTQRLVHDSNHGSSRPSDVFQDSTAQCPMSLKFGAKSGTWKELLRMIQEGRWEERDLVFAGKWVETHNSCCWWRWEKLCDFSQLYTCHVFFWLRFLQPTDIWTTRKEMRTVSWWKESQLLGMESSQQELIQVLLV